MADVEKTSQAIPEAPHGDEFDFEHQEPKTNLIALLLVSSCVILVVIVVLLQGFYDFTRALKVSRTESAPFEQIQKLRADEEQKLTGYRYVNKESGVVQIPVERAMQLMVEEAKAGQPKYIQGIQGGAAAPAASPVAQPQAPKAAAAQAGGGKKQ